MIAVRGIPNTCRRVEASLTSATPAQATRSAFQPSWSTPLYDGSTCRAMPNAIPRSCSPPHPSPTYACSQAGSHALRKRRPALRIRQPLQHTHEVGSSLSPTSKFIHLLQSRSSTTAVHPHRSARFPSTLAPKYVHISSSAIAPFFDTTAHRCSTCACYARRRRYARALYARLNRLSIDLLREARLIGFRRVLPLAVAALVNLPSARIHLRTSNWHCSVGILTSCRYTLSRAIDRLLDSSLSAIISNTTHY